VIIAHQGIREKTHIHLYNQSGVVEMYRGLVVSGLILGAFGIFLVFTDLYAPLGVSIFGLPMSILGGIMFVVGLLRSEPAPIEPARGKKFCWYCMKEIPKESKDCPYCSLLQHDAKD
jgi:hypothetical protein